MCRSADTGDAAAGHAADARQRPDAVLLRLLHLRHRRRPAVGRAPAQPLLPRSARQRLRRPVRIQVLQCTRADDGQWSTQGEANRAAASPD